MPASSKPYVLSIANQKGGVGKTTLTVGLGESLARLGYDVLVIDYDGQANLTGWVYGQKLEPDDVNVLDVLATDDWTLLNTADEAEGFGFDFIGSTEELFDLEVKLSNDNYRVFALRRAVSELKTKLSGGSESASGRRYDFCLVDCPPALGLAVTQALNASDGVLVPTILEKMAIEGLKMLTDEIEQARMNGRADVELVGVVPTIVHVVRSQTKSIAGVLRDRFGEAFLEEEQIPVRTKISEASAVSRPIRAYCEAHDSSEHEYFDSLARTVARRTIGEPTQDSGPVNPAVASET
jgi:chromosome partitioning protein